jgi:GDSL-like Lipase/Acylhydrolase family
MRRRLKWRGRSGRDRQHAVQGKLAFAVKAEQNERRFKRSIAAATALVIIGLIAGTSSGREAALASVRRARTLLDRIVGVPYDPASDRQHVLAARLRDAASARQTLAKMTTPGSPGEQFLRAAGMDASSAVIRWGNVNRSIVLSSAVFEPDDERAYRLKPGVRSIWVIGISLTTSLGMFLVPDTPEIRELAMRAGGAVVPESLQTTNSWGFRGPEPDPTAPVRVVVLGDSMMQGALVGDQDTPPAKLGAYLATALETRVSVLNTGHIGYSLEQYDQTLRAVGDRFHPQYVVISVSQNDFVDLNDPASWSEGEYWLNRIADFCRSRGWQFLIVPCADEFAVLGPKHVDRFQGQFCRIVKYGATSYVDPAPAFSDVLLRLQNDAARHGKAMLDPLFNLHLMGDRHFSPVGSDLWARVVTRRVLINWDRLVLMGLDCPEPVSRHARKDNAWIPGVESAGVGQPLSAVIIPDARGRLSYMLFGAAGDSNASAASSR